MSQLSIHDFGNVGEVNIKDTAVPKLQYSCPPMSLVSPESGGEAITYSRVSSFDARNLIVPRHYSLSEAVVEARRRVSLLPVGSEFTTNGLFGDILLRSGDSRGRAALIFDLRRDGVIVAAGVTQQDQGRRNNGFATLWRKVV